MVGEGSLRGRALPPPFLQTEQAPFCLYLSYIYWRNPGGCFCYQIPLIEPDLEKLSQEECKVICVRFFGGQALPGNLPPESWARSTFPWPWWLGAAIRLAVSTSSLDPNSKASGPPSYPSGRRSHESHPPKFLRTSVGPLDVSKTNNFFIGSKRIRFPRGG